MACLQLLLGTAPNWHYTPAQLNDATTGWPVLGVALMIGSADACKLLIAAGADKQASVRHGNTVMGFAALARGLWPDKPELAALFDPGVVQETPPCCANCLKSGIKLRACSKCHSAQYCSTACQRAHWRAHKSVCMTPKDAYDARAADLASKLRT
jgi:hypothetical protein